MAGKAWSEQEEEYFWLHIIPFSRRRRGVDLSNPELSFQQLAGKMRDAFSENARRQYTALTLEEHYYQNIEIGRISKNAHKWVKEYRAAASEYPGLPEKSNRATHEANNDVEPAHVATKAGAETDWEIGGNENADKRAAILKLAAPGDQERSGQTGGTAMENHELFAGPAGPATSGYDSDRTVTDISDEVIGGGTQQSGAEGATEATTHPQGNGNAHGVPVGTNQGAQEAVHDTIVVGGLSFSEDDTSADEDSDYQQDDNEPANQ